MQDILSMVSSLKRPRLLVSAARFGQDSYNRAAHLPRLLGAPGLPRHGEAILHLSEREAEAEAGRKAHAADYSVARHVDLLIALMAEARLLRSQQRAA